MAEQQNTFLFLLSSHNSHDVLNRLTLEAFKWQAVVHGIIISVSTIIQNKYCVGLDRACRSQHISIINQTK